MSCDHDSSKTLKKTVKIDLNTDSVMSYLFLSLCIDALQNNKKIEDE